MAGFPVSGSQEQTEKQRRWKSAEGTESKISKLVNGPWLPLVWGLRVPTTRAIGFEDTVGEIRS